MENNKLSTGLTVWLWIIFVLNILATIGGIVVALGASVAGATLGLGASIADFLIFSPKKRLLKMDKYLKISILYDIFCCIETGYLYMVYILMKRKGYER